MFVLIRYSATHVIHTLSLHDALPIYGRNLRRLFVTNDGCSSSLTPDIGDLSRPVHDDQEEPLKIGRGTRLNSSHLVISYAVFCLKKKKIPKNNKIPVMDEVI